MEIIQITAYAGLCIGWIATILAKKHQNMNWQKAQEYIMDQHATDVMYLDADHKKEIDRLKLDHESELAEMEASCQEREQYEKNRADQANKAFKELQIKYEIERSRNRNLRTGFNVEATCRAVDIVKGVRVS